MKKERIFNLLKPIKPPPSVWDKVYDWIIGKARIVILVVELLVVVAFVLKVVEDTNAKNKDKEIERQEMELSFYASESEPRFREIQGKADVYSEVWNSSSNYTEVVNEVFAFIGLDQPSVTVRVSQGRLTIIGYDNLENLRKLEESLKTKSETLDRQSVKVGNLTLGQKDVEEGKAQIVLEAIIKKDLTRKNI